VRVRCRSPNIVAIGWQHGCQFMTSLEERRNWWCRLRVCTLASCPLSTAAGQNSPLRIARSQQASTAELWPAIDTASVSWAAAKTCDPFRLNQGFYGVGHAGLAWTTTTQMRCWPPAALTAFTQLGTHVEAIEIRGRSLSMDPACRSADPVVMSAKMGRLARVLGGAHRTKGNRCLGMSGTWCGIRPVAGTL
jgi:hypothetical protein